MVPGDSLSETASKACVSVPVTIAAGASLSNGINLGEGVNVVGVVMPAAWTAAPLSLQVSADGVTWVPLGDATGAVYKIATPAASMAYGLDANMMRPWNWVKVQSGVPGTTVNQAAAAVLTLIARTVA